MNYKNKMDLKSSYLENVQIQEHEVKNEENGLPDKIVAGGCPICTINGDTSEYTGQIKHLSIPIGLVVVKYTNKSSMKKHQPILNIQHDDIENIPDDVISPDKFNLLFEKCMLKTKKNKSKKEKVIRQQKNKKTKKNIPP